MDTSGETEATVLVKSLKGRYALLNEVKVDFARLAFVCMFFHRL
jgi:hypothetical protein